MPCPNCGYAALRPRSGNLERAVRFFTALRDNPRAGREALIRATGGNHAALNTLIADSRADLCGACYKIGSGPACPEHAA